MQTVHPGSEPVACPKCKSRNWVEIRGYHSMRKDSDAWLQHFLSALQGAEDILRWR